MALCAALRTSFKSRIELRLEVLALRQQIHVLERSRRSRPRLSSADRVFWVSLSRVWTGWRRPLVIVQPATVLAWHRQGFRWFWRWKSHRRPGRPVVPADVRALIRTMSDANRLWGAPRIHGELLKLGIPISQASVAKYMVRSRQPPSQTWRTFLANHRDQLMAIDFFVVPTATYRLLFVLVLLAHDRRRIVHFAVSAHPTAAWTAQQLREACPWDSAPRFLIHDRDHAFDRLGTTAKAMGIHELLIAPGPTRRAPAGSQVAPDVREQADVDVLKYSGTHEIWLAAVKFLRHTRPNLDRAGDAIPAHSSELQRALS
jgi:putative transposase